MIAYNYFNVKNKWKIESLLSFGPYYNYTEYSRMKMQDFMAGYYKRTKKNLFVGAFGGISNGYVENQYEFGTSKFKINRILLQPLIGYRNKFFETAVSCRIERLEYSNPHISGFFDIDEDDTKNMLYVRDNPVQFLFEPSISLRGGYKLIKLQLQAGGSFSFNAQQFRQVHIYLRTGVVISLRKDEIKFPKKGSN
jgi:hypothetical protein